MGCLFKLILFPVYIFVIWPIKGIFFGIKVLLMMLGLSFLLGGKK